MKFDQHHNRTREKIIADAALININPVALEISHSFPSEGNLANIMNMTPDLRIH